MNGWDELDDRIRRELEMLSAEVDAIQPLYQKLQLVAPDTVEIRAAAATLHAFYTGAERVLLFIARRIDDDMPSGVRWHRDLLEQVASPTRSRAPVISDSMKTTLVGYLGFRHVFRSHYPGTLRWDQFGGLFSDLPRITHEFCEEIRSFLERNQRVDGPS